jgi:translation initiation factor IF-3
LLKTINKPRINNQIIAAELRVVGKDGENLGVLKRDEALVKAGEMELDLIEIAPTAKPPVAKIMDYGKYLYQQQKKDQESAKKSKEVETKVIQIGLGTSGHDLEMKAKKIEEFFKEGNRVRVNLVLRGRAKATDKNFIKERMDRLLGLIPLKYKIADGLKTGPRGVSMIIEYDR